MILDSIFPVFALIALGAILKRRGFTDRAFLKQGDRLVYYIFFPALLFWKIGGTPAPEAVPWRLWIAVLSSSLLMWILSLVVIAAFRLGAHRAGAFTQGTFRFNTYVAIAVVLGAQGQTGVARLGEILSVAIPLSNVLAVVTFIWFSRESIDQKDRLRLTFGALVRNPLILACVAGMTWARLLPAWPTAVDNTLQLTASLTLPFGLISIGGSLSFTELRHRLAPATGATFLKLLVLPVMGYGFLEMVGIEGPDRLTAMLFFAMPASTAMYNLTSQLDGDADLSSAMIVLSTMASFVSLSVVLLVFG